MKKTDAIKSVVLLTAFLCVSNVSAQQQQDAQSDAQKAIESILAGVEKLKTQDPQTVAMEEQKKLQAEAADPEPEKYGGPSKEVILKLMNGGNISEADNPSNQNQAMMAALGNLAPKIKQIKRGEPVKAVISRKIPSGTVLFPIRLVMSDSGLIAMLAAGSGMGGSPTAQSVINVDYYFYKDSFGDWNSIKRN